MDIKIPNVGESITEARIVRWLKNDGDYVKADEPVLEIETDKASDSVPAPVAGIVRIKVPADQVVAIGAVVGSVEPGQAPSPTSSAASVAEKPRTPPSSATSK